MKRTSQFAVALLLAQSCFAVRLNTNALQQGQANSVSGDWNEFPLQVKFHDGNCTQTYVSPHSVTRRPRPVCAKDAKATDTPQEALEKENKATKEAEDAVKTEGKKSESKESADGEKKESGEKKAKADEPETEGKT